MRTLLGRLFGEAPGVPPGRRGTIGRHASGARRARQRTAALERLEQRLALSTSVGGTITQGNLYGGQSVVLATPILRSGRPTEIQLIDTGDTGMGQQSVRTFVPFRLCQGELNLAVGDFLHKGYQQLVVGSGRGIEARVAIFDLFQTFAAEGASAPGGALSKPVRLQTLFPFKGFHGGATLASADFDGDGCEELAVGAGPGGAPRVKIYSPGRPGDAPPPTAPTLLGFFNAFPNTFRGGVTLAAGHVTGATRAELVVGSGAGGGSTVKVFAGADVVSSAKPAALLSYQAFPTAAPTGSTKPAAPPAIQVQLVESITAPDWRPVTGLDAQGRTATFTPADDAPLARGTIVAYPSGPTTAGRVSLCSMVSGTPDRREVTLPPTAATAGAPFRIHLTPVGYLFDHSVGDPLAPAVLVADPVRSAVSLFPLHHRASEDSLEPVKNIYTTGGPKPTYDRHSFPFGTAIQGDLAVAVKLLESDVATAIAPGTSGMLPSRQVAYQSPFPLTFRSDVDALLHRYADGFFMKPEHQSALPVDRWYDAGQHSTDWGGDIYGPDMAAFGTLAGFPSIDSTDPNFWRESMVAAGLQFMNRGVFYQHHHLPAWWGVPPRPSDSDMGPTLQTYDAYSYTPTGIQTPGLDCSDFSALVVNMVTGEKIKEGISAQDTVVAGKTQWGTTLEGSSDIRIVEEDGTVSRDILSWCTLATYFERHGALATYAMLDRTLAPGDLLYYSSDIPSEAIPAHESLSISQSSHVTIWTGQTLPIPGRSDVGVPLIMDSHGGNIQVGVDAANRPIGVVEPSGPQLRPFFAPTLATTSDAYVHLRSFLPADTYADQNYYYLTSFSHAVRIHFPVPS